MPAPCVDAGCGHGACPLWHNLAAGLGAPPLLWVVYSGSGLAGHWCQELQSIADGNAAVLRSLLDGSVTNGLTFEIPMVCDGLFAGAAFDSRKRMVELILEAGADVNENSDV